MTIEIVPMGAEHLDALAEIEKLCFAQPWSRQSLEEEIGNPNACFFAAVCAKQTAGYIGAHFACGEFAVDNLAVHPAYRRRGVGRALLTALVDFARRSAGEAIFLEVRPSNKAAVALYESLGFTRAGLRRGFYTHPKEDALLLVKRFA